MESLVADIISEDFVGLALGFFVAVVVPLVAILLHHQRKMAELIHRNSSSEQDRVQVARLENEVRELKDRLNHAILQVEERRTLPTQPPTPPVSDRLEDRLR